MNTSFIKTIICCLFCLFHFSCGSSPVEEVLPDPGPDPKPPVSEVLTLRTASYNLRMLTSSDTGNKAWAVRKDHADKIIRKYDFDLFGTQELVMSQINDLLALNEKYAYMGVGRNEGTTTGEFSAIFYKKDQFEVLDQGTFWLSQTPDIPSKGWDASLNRICTWGKFKEKESGKAFYFFNTHFDHVGTIARKESAKLILSKMKSIAGDSPAFCTGDFNLQPETEAMQTLILSKYIWDARSSSVETPAGTVGTFHGYNIAQASYTNRIDYVFVTAQITVRSYATINDDIELQTFSSDHFPVFVKAEL